jgi:hypothetical protein
MTRPVQTSPYTVDSHSRECSSSPASSTLHWTLNCRAYRAWHPAFNLCRTSRETEMERRDQQHTGTVARDRGRGQNRLEASPPRRRPGVNKLMESQSIRLLTGSTPSPPPPRAHRPAEQPAEMVQCGTYTIWQGSLRPVRTPCQAACAAAESTGRVERAASRRLPRA